MYIVIQFKKNWMLFITYIKCILSIIIMSSNRVQYFIRSILQNSKLNREKFVNNKKKYNMTTIKNRNHNMINKRNFSTYSQHNPPVFGNGPNGPKGPNGPGIFTIFIMATGLYLATGRFNSAGYNKK